MIYHNILSYYIDDIAYMLTYAWVFEEFAKHLSTCCNIACRLNVTKNLCFKIIWKLLINIALFGSL